MRALRHSASVMRAVGWENIPNRLLHILSIKSGWKRLTLPGGRLSNSRMRRQFVREYSQDCVLNYWDQRANLFFSSTPRPALARLLKSIVTDTEWALTNTASEDLDDGYLELFGHIKVKTGPSIDFNRDPLHHVNWPTPRHWTRYRHFDPALADIKCVWEPSRFSIAYKLARDYIRNGNARAPEQFASLAEQWIDANPYGLTPQWICGQEATFRFMAILFATCTMLNGLRSKQDLLQSISELAWYTARHIEKNIRYARSQKNNHAISEAVGLWTIGLLFPEFSRAPYWRRTGSAILSAEASRQFYGDGSYVQHSLNYHRVALDDLLWSFALSRSAGCDVDESLCRTMQSATEWLLQFVDLKEGRVPNYGANDGANILPLSCADYSDFRPTLQAAHYAAFGTRCLSPGLWDEKLVWLFGPRALDAPCKSLAAGPSWAAREGGYYLTRGDSSWGFVRIHTYVDRPVQADMLHFDLWHAGTNLLRDGGSFQYFSRDSLSDYFNSTAAHNVVEVDGLSQMKKGPRFLWLDWTKSKVSRFTNSDNGRVTWIDGEHYGYTRLQDPVTHRRAILRVDDTYVIVDDVLGRDAHGIILRWRLAPQEWSHIHDRWECAIGRETLGIQVVASAALSSSLCSGNSFPTPEGWEARYYAAKTPSPTLVIKGEAVPLPIRLVSIVGPIGSMPTAVLPIGVSTPLRMRSYPCELADTISRLTNGTILCC